MNSPLTTSSITYATAPTVAALGVCKVSSVVERRADNPVVTGSSPVPCTKREKEYDPVGKMRKSRPGTMESCKGPKSTDSLPVRRQQRQWRQRGAVTARFTAC